MNAQDITFLQLNCKNPAVLETFLANKTVAIRQASWDLEFAIDHFGSHSPEVRGAEQELRDQAAACVVAESFLAEDLRLESILEHLARQPSNGYVPQLLASAR